MDDLKNLGFKKTIQGGEVNRKNPDGYLESLLGKVGADLLRGTGGQSSFLEDYSAKIPEAPFVPKNPFDETNENLSDIGATLKSESSKNSVSSNKWNRTMFFISICALIVSVLALIISAVFSILAFNSSTESSNKLESLMIEQNKLLKTNIAENESIKRNLNEKLTNENNKKNIDPKIKTIS